MLIRHRVIAFAAAALLLAACGSSSPPSAGSCAASPPAWRAAWANSPAGDVVITPWLQHPSIVGLPSPADASYRLIVRPTVPGTALRLRFTNASGSQPLRIASAYVGRRSGEPASNLAGAISGADVLPGSQRRLLFSGQPELVVPPGGSARSDPLDYEVAAFEDLAVSLHVPEPSRQTIHGQSLVTQFHTRANAGDRSADESGAAYTEVQEPMPWLDALEVLGPAQRVIVAIGDSITDGDLAGAIDDSMMDRYQRYPDFLARHLAAAGIGAAVINQGVNGDTGPGVRARIGHDVFDLAGVTDVILGIGTNDITRLGSGAQVIASIDGLADEFHARGLRVFVTTLVPRNGLPGVAARAQVNDWVRSSPKIDGVLDINRAVSQPGSEEVWNPAYNSGDFTHPNPAGYEAIAKALDIEAFRQQGCVD